MFLFFSLASERKLSIENRDIESVVWLVKVVLIVVTLGRGSNLHP